MQLGYAGYLAGAGRLRIAARGASPATRKKGTATDFHTAPMLETKRFGERKSDGSPPFSPETHFCHGLLGQSFTVGGAFGAVLVLVLAWGVSPRRTLHRAAVLRLARRLLCVFFPGLAPGARVGAAVAASSGAWRLCGLENQPQDLFGFSDTPSDSGDAAQLVALGPLPLALFLLTNADLVASGPRFFPGLPVEAFGCVFEVAGHVRILRKYGHNGRKARTVRILETVFLRVGNAHNHSI